MYDLALTHSVYNNFTIKSIHMKKYISMLFTLYNKYRPVRGPMSLRCRGSFFRFGKKLFHRARCVVGGAPIRQPLPPGFRHHLGSCYVVPGTGSVGLCRDRRFLGESWNGSDPMWWSPPPPDSEPGNPVAA